MGYLVFHISGDNVSFIIDLRHKRIAYEKKLFRLAVYVAQNNILSVDIPMNKLFSFQRVCDIF